MTKEEFLKNLDLMIENEERLTPIYIRHMEVVLQWSGMTEEHKKSARAILEVLANDCKEHSRTFEELKRRVLAGEINVY